MLLLWPNWIKRSIIIWVATHWRNDTYIDFAMLLHNTKWNHS